jgi:hypothetical protein
MCCWQGMRRIYAIPMEGKLFFLAFFQKYQYQKSTNFHTDSDLREVCSMPEHAPMP